MTSLHITVGIPASGKSTWAREWVAEDPTDRRRVNRDDTRTFLGLKHGDNEPFVTEVQQHIVRLHLSRGESVVVDDTNLVPKFAKEWLKIAQEFSAEVVWHDEFLKVDPRVCIDRDRNREAKVGADVIMRMAERAKQWKRPKLSEVPDLSGFKPYHGTPGKPKAYLVDIDGTVALNGDSRDNPARGWFDWHRVGEDKPNEKVVTLVRAIDGLLPVFVSGRDAACRDITSDWIRREIWPERFDWVPVLHMRPEGDNRKDSLVKLEIFDREIRDNYDVQFAIDDRNQVVRAYRDVLGLTVLQVADGDF